MISGSGEDSWNDTPWLVELRKKIVEYDASGVKMSGFSFAPQVLAVALVSEEPLFGGNLYIQMIILPRQARDSTATAQH